MVWLRKHSYLVYQAILITYYLCGFLVIPRIPRGFVGYASLIYFLTLLVLAAFLGRWVVKYNAVRPRFMWWYPQGSNRFFSWFYSAIAVCVFLVVIMFFVDLYQVQAIDNLDIFLILMNIFIIGFIAFAIYYFHGLIYKNFGTRDYENSLRWFPSNLISRSVGEDNYIFFAKIRMLFGIVVGIGLELLFFGLLVSRLSGGG